MSLLTKPWEEGAGEVLERGQVCSLPTGWLGLGAFITVVTVMFALLSMSYFVRMAVYDWIPMIEPDMLWVNTLFLAFSSLSFHAAWMSSRADGSDGANKSYDLRNMFMALGGVFAFAFLGGQSLAWLELYAQGILVENNPAITFFYYITALHAVHLLGGLLAWGRTTIKIRQGASSDKVQRSLELCTSYWHFLLLLWMLMFVLLVLDNNGKFDLIAICRAFITGE